jgi:hypothetical protein
MYETQERGNMILDLEMPTDEAVREAIRYFRQRGGLTSKKKPARLWDDLDWKMFFVDREIFHASDDRVRRDRYK